MNYLDLILIGILLFGCIRGFIKGFIIEVASLAALFAGGYFGILLADIGGQVISAFVSWNPIAVKIVLLFIFFLLVVFLVITLAKIIEKTVKTFQLNLFNRIAGFVFGFLKTAFILSFLLIFAVKINQKITFVNAETIENSKLLPPLESLAQTILPSKDFINTNFKDHWKRITDKPSTNE